MFRTRESIALAIAILTSIATHTSADERRPNVLFVMADDLNCDLGCYGNSFVQSPQIDRLARRGARFERAYCQYPVCNPSRVSLLTGLRPDATRVVDNRDILRDHLPDAVCLGEWFRRHGYRTMKLGKIFHSIGDDYEDPRSWDFDLRETSEAKNPPQEQILRRQGAGNSGIVLGVEDDQAWDGKLARRGAELLAEGAAGEQPFFLAIGFRRPHTPYIAPAKYFDHYPPHQVPPLIEPAAHVSGIPPVALTYNVGFPKLTGEERAATAAAYWASLTYMDAQLGVLLDALDNLKLWDNTIVLFVSDHGYHLGEHGGLWHKMSLFEQSARVPLVVAAPRRPASIVRGIVEMIDIYPTLTELCGLPIPGRLAGQSFVPLLDNQHAPGKQAAFTVVGRVGDGPNDLDPDRLSRSVRTPRWRYTEWHDGSRELYDHDNDPAEHVNLAGVPAHFDTVDELSALLKQPASFRTDP
jgi:arylsulfatase A-like enzyme